MTFRIGVIFELLVESTQL